MSIKRETVEQRKALPLAAGVLDYFPDALLAVAEVSRVGNEQHHPGEPLHWDKSKSTDEADALMRHLLDRGSRDVDGLRHTAKVAWRALALLQRELDAEAAEDAEADAHCSDDPYVKPEHVNDAVRFLMDNPDARLPAEWTIGPVVKSEPWGTGDGPVYGMERATWSSYGAECGHARRYLSVAGNTVCGLCFKVLTEFCGCPANRVIGKPMVHLLTCPQFGA